MADDPRRQPSRGLDAARFDRLLRALGPDRRTAGDRYEDLRRRLIKYFAWQRCEVPDELADEALNRLAQKISEGVEPEDVFAYSLTIARFVWMEYYRRRNRHESLGDHAELLTNPVPESEQPDREALASALDACLGTLSAESRSLILRYYRGQERERIRARQELAAELGVDSAALRNRALRLRHRLEECISRRLGRRGAEQ